MPRFGKAVNLRGTKAGLFDPDVVSSHRNLRSRKLTSLTAADVSYVGGAVGDDDLSLGNSRATRIADGSGNGATLRLSNEHGTQEKQQGALAHNPADDPTGDNNTLLEADVKL